MEIRVGGEFYNNKRKLCCQNDSCKHFVQTGERKTLEDSKVREFVTIHHEFAEYGYAYDGQTHSLTLCMNCWNQFYSGGMSAINPSGFIDKHYDLEVAAAYHEVDPVTLPEKEKKQLSKSLFEKLKEIFSMKNAS